MGATRGFETANEFFVIAIKEHDTVRQRTAIAEMIERGDQFGEVMRTDIDDDGEAGHAAMLDALDARPLLNLDMRLGEGTGALLAAPLLRAAAALLSQVASLEDVLEGRL